MLDLQQGSLITDPSPLMTHDRDEAHLELSRLFVQHRLDVISGSLDVTARALHLPGIAIVDLAQGAEVEVTPGQLGTHYKVNTILSGHMRTVCGKDAGETGVGSAAVLSPDGKSAMRWSSDLRILAVKIDRVMIEEELRAVLGRELETALVFDVTMDTHTGMGQSWLASLLELVRDVQQPLGAELPDAVIRHLQGLVITKLLYGQPSNYLAQLSAPARQRVHPRRVQRVIDAIHADPAAAHTASELAAVAGVSLRSLQESFREHVGASPMGYLRTVRLLGAHDALQAADPSETTVTTVAHAWGFGHVSRFAEQYRRRFGESPSATLHT